MGENNLGLIPHQPSIKGVKLNISALSNFG